MGFSWVLIFGPGIFWGFDSCTHSIIPVTRNPEVPPGTVLLNLKLIEVENTSRFCSVTRELRFEMKLPSF